MGKVRLWLFELFEYYQGYRKIMLFWAFALTTYQAHRSNDSHDLAILNNANLIDFAASTASIIVPLTALTGYAYKIYSDSRDKESEDNK